MANKHKHEANSCNPISFESTECTPQNTRKEKTIIFLYAANQAATESRVGFRIPSFPSPESLPNFIEIGSVVSSGSTDGKQLFEQVLGHQWKNAPFGSMKKANMFSLLI